MKKQSLKNCNYEEKQRPVNRRTQFKDILKNSYSLLFRLGLLFFVFTIPLFVTLTVFNYIGESLISGEAELMVYILNDLLFDSCVIISLIIASIGISGCDRIYRMICWDEPVIFYSDFKEGIKLNFKNNFIVCLIFGLILSCVNVVSDIITIANTTSVAGIVVFSVLSGFVVFVISPLVMVILAFNSYYKDSFGKMIVTSSKITVYRYIPIVLFVLPFVLLLVLYLYTDVIYLLVYAVVVALAGPIFTIGWRLYILSVFDFYINSNYKEYYKKGLYIGGMQSEEN